MKPEDKDSKLNISKITALKYLHFVVSDYEVFVISICRLPLCSNAPGKKNHIRYDRAFVAAVLFFLHAQSTNEENICQAMHEQEAQNVVVLHVA